MDDFEILEPEFEQDEPKKKEDQRPNPYGYRKPTYDEDGTPLKKTSSTGTQHYTREEIADFALRPHELRVYPKWKGIYWNKKLEKLGKYMSKDVFAELIAQEDIPELLEKLYTDPKLGFNGYTKMWNYVWRHYLGVSSRDVKDFLRSYEPHQLHQGLPSSKVTRPIVVSRPNAQWQMDLANFWEYRHHNNGYTYLLVFIDVNSKYMFARPIKRKFPEDVLGPLKEILKELHEKGLKNPSVIQSDNGSEFMGSVDAWIKSEEMKHVLSTSHNPRSQAVVERSNGTIKRMLGRWMTENNTRKWVDALQDIVDNYNNSYHSTIRMTPKEALFGDGRTQEKVYNRLQSAANKLDRKLKTQPPLKVGDYVRLSLVKEDHKERALYQSGFRKTGSVINWSKQIYKVIGVSAGQQPHHVQMRQSYKIATLEGTKMPGRYFRHHLLKTVPPDQVTGKVQKPNKDIQKLDDDFKNRKFDDNPEQKQRAEAHLEKAKDEPIALRLRRKRPKPSEEELEEKYDNQSDGEQEEETKGNPANDKNKKEDNEKDDDEQLYVPEKIIGEKKVKGRKLYKIKWKGYPESESTWEPLKNIIRGKEGFLAQWEIDKRKKKKS